MEPVIGQLEQVSLIGYMSTVDKSNAEEEETITSELVERLLGQWENVQGIQDECLYMMWTWDNRLEGTDKGRCSSASASATSLRPQAI